MKLNKPLVKKRSGTKEKLQEKFHTRLLIFCLVASVIYTLFEPKFIGNKRTYYLITSWIPITLGLLALGIYFRKLIFKELYTQGNFLTKALMTLFLLGTGIIFSFTSIGLITKMTVDLIQQKVADGNKTAVICPIKKFTSGKSSHVYFIFQGRLESVRLSYNSIKPFLNEKPADYELELLVEQGIIGLYTLKEWQIVNAR